MKKSPAAAPVAVPYKGPGIVLGEAAIESHPAKEVEVDMELIKTVRIGNKTKIRVV